MKSLNPQKKETYELPQASYDTLGGVKIGEDLNISQDGLLNLNTISSSKLPLASTSSVGGVKVGNYLSINDNGNLDVLITTGTTDPPSNLPTNSIYLQYEE